MLADEVHEREGVGVADKDAVWDTVDWDNEREAVTERDCERVSVRLWDGTVAVTRRDWVAVGVMEGCVAVRVCTCDWVWLKLSVWLGVRERWDIVQVLLTLGLRESVPVRLEVSL